MGESMKSRPVLNRELNSKTFLSYYYLKEELAEFCRDNRLSVSGSKSELTKRISYYLDTGKKLPVKIRKKKNIATDKIEKENIIEKDIVCSEKHCAFFREQIGSGFKFNVEFQKWLKSNAGKTYGDAVDAYYRILENKKYSKSKIDKQFEYNAYIRDFFEDNKGKALNDAIKCWKYKKSIPGHNRYEKCDLEALK